MDRDCEETGPRMVFALVVARFACDTVEGSWTVEARERDGDRMADDLQDEEEGVGP